MEALASKIGVTERHLYRIENEGQKPSYNVLYKLIRELNISPDKIFYPETPIKDSEVESLIRLLKSCDPKLLPVITATTRALIEASSGEKMQEGVHPSDI